MRIIGNIIWLIFGGIELAIGYLVSGVILCLTIIGIPFGIQVIKIAYLSLLPFGREVSLSKEQGGCLSTVMNVFWIFIGGLAISISHILVGLVFYITIIGIPFGRQHFKLASVALTPFGRTIVRKK